MTLSYKTSDSSGKNAGSNSELEVMFTERFKYYQIHQRIFDNTHTPSIKMHPNANYKILIKHILFRKTLGEVPCLQWLHR